MAAWWTSSQCEHLYFPKQKGINKSGKWRCSIIRSLPLGDQVKLQMTGFHGQLGTPAALRPSAPKSSQGSFRSLLSHLVVSAGGCSPAGVSNLGCKLESARELKNNWHPGPAPRPWFNCSEVYVGHGDFSKLSGDWNILPRLRNTGSWGLGKGHLMSKNLLEALRMTGLDI